MRRTLSVLVEDRPGVLTHVSGLISRRAFNIVSINAGYSEGEGMTRITVVVEVENQNALEQVINQLQKLIDVIKVVNLTDMPSLTRELAMVKVFAPAKYRHELVDIVNIFRAKIVDIHPDCIVIELTGEEDKIDAICVMLEKFGIIEIVRTGRVAMPRDLIATKDI